MRIFTAIPFPEKTKQEAARLFQGRLPVAYVNAGNLHVTLNFFGEVPEEQTKLLFKVGAQVAGRHKPFLVFFEKIVKFGNQIHLLVKPTNALLALQADLEKEFGDCGFKFQDRKYYPHVKLSNLHMDKIFDKNKRIENFPNSELTVLDFQADRIMVFQSELLLHHARHTVIKEFKFA